MEMDAYEVAHELPLVDTPPRTPQPVVNLPVQEMEKLNFDEGLDELDLLDGPEIDVSRQLSFSDFNSSSGQHQYL